MQPIPHSGKKIICDIDLLSKPNEDIISKEKYRPVSLMNEYRFKASKNKHFDKTNLTMNKKIICYDQVGIF